LASEETQRRIEAEQAAEKLRGELYQAEKKAIEAALKAAEEFLAKEEELTANAEALKK